MAVLRLFLKKDLIRVLHLYFLQSLITGRKTTNLDLVSRLESRIQGIVQLRDEAVAHFWWEIFSLLSGWFFVYAIKSLLYSFFLAILILQGNVANPQNYGFTLVSLYLLLWSGSNCVRFPSSEVLQASQ
uniref:Uncharacterized protein n=1 Tax=Opuntia streptacantha TaxID=393608 RepID=A0A7C9DDT1_OPUST